MQSISWVLVFWRAAKQYLIYEEKWTKVSTLQKAARRKCLLTVRIYNFLWLPTHKTSEYLFQVKECFQFARTGRSGRSVCRSNASFWRDGTCYFEEMRSTRVKVILEIDAFRLQTDRSSPPVLTNAKYPKTMNKIRISQQKIWLAHHACHDIHELVCSPNLVLIMVAKYREIQLFHNCPSFSDNLTMLQCCKVH